MLEGSVSRGVFNEVGQFHGKGEYTVPCGYKLKVIMNKGCIEKVESNEKVVTIVSNNPVHGKKEGFRKVEYSDGSIYEGMMQVINKSQSNPNGEYIRQGLGKLTIEKYGYKFDGA